MNITEIRKLVEIIKRHDLREFELNEGDFSIRITRGVDPTIPVVQTTSVQPGYLAPHQIHTPSSSVTSEITSPVRNEEIGVEIITSPMVGTFYRAPSPDSKVFVNKGDKISSDSVVCIIEAMKVMNEIQAEISGEILEILVGDGDSVEFGQPLFKVKS